MATRIKIKVESHADEVLQELDRKIRLALGAMGEVVEGHAKADCPVDTGLLRNSITYALSGESPAISSYHADKTSTGKSATTGRSGSVGVGFYGGVSGATKDRAVYVGSNVEYAAAVELDGSKAHTVGRAHFLRDGAQNHIAELKDTASKILNS